MRIITGVSRGARLATLDGEATRPTAERVKEALFSMIQFNIEGRSVLDLFSGSGQLALEALSRGAERATMVDSSREAVAIIKANAQKTKLFDKCRVLQSDYKEYLRGASRSEKFDIVFLDPPYAENLVGDAIERILRFGLLNPGAMLVCETGSEEPVTAEGMTVLRHSRYGKTYITLLEYKAAI